MPSVTVRIDEATREKLRAISAQEEEPMQVILERAIEEYRRKRFLEEANAAFARLKSNPAAWQEELEERAAWDATIGDGLEDE